MTIAMHLSKHSRFTGLAILTLISVAVTAGWWHSGLPRGHDALGFITAEGFEQCAAVHKALPEWSTIYVLGWPVAYLWPPLVFAAEFVLAELLGWVVALKLLYIGIFVLSGIFAYLYVYELTTHRFASFIAGLLYIFIPFHLIEVALEGQWDIGAGYMLTPLVFLATERAIKAPKAKTVALAGVSLALLILTHPQVFPILVGPFWLAYVILRIWMERQRRRIVISAAACVSVLVIGLLLSAFEWVPWLSEGKYLHAQYSGPLPDFNATLLQAITLRPYTCCAYSSAYSPSDQPLAQLLTWLPILLVVLGIASNHKNKYVWFFAASVLVLVPLSMGERTPLFDFLQDRIYLFTQIRTPERLLLFSSFAYAILGSLGAKSVLQGLKTHHKLSMILVVALPVCLVANTWQEYRDAFSTFHLTADQRGAIEWLSEQDKGRVMQVPLDCYLYSPEFRATFNPVSYHWMHGQEVVYDNPFHSGIIGSIRIAADKGITPIGDAADVLDIQYLVVCKSEADSSSYVWDDSFVKAWESETIDIYRHTDAYSRIFTTTSSPIVTTSEDDDWKDLSPLYAAIANNPEEVNSVESYTMVHPGEYRVELSSTDTRWLVLSESYYPGWVAKVDGKVLPSEEVLGGVNGWHLSEAGSHEVILEFHPSSQRSTDRIISMLTAIGIVTFFAGQYVKRRRDKSKQLQATDQ